MSVTFYSRYLGQTPAGISSQIAALRGQLITVDDEATRYKQIWYTSINDIEHTNARLKFEEYQTSGQLIRDEILRLETLLIEPDQANDIIQKLNQVLTFVEDAEASHPAFGNTASEKTKAVIKSIKCFT